MRCPTGDATVPRIRPNRSTAPRETVDGGCMRRGDDTPLLVDQEGCGIHALSLYHRLKANMWDLVASGEDGARVVRDGEGALRWLVPVAGANTTTA